MKKIFVLAVIISFFNCKNKTMPSIDNTVEQPDVSLKVYPESVTKVFDAHGGIDNWNKMQSLVFTMKKPDGDEITTTDLKDRTSLIEMQNHIIGFDGEDVWLKQKDTAQYKGNAKFYYNLMFYFYAMPFVLGDDGVIYEDVKPLEFEGTSYPGIKIAYESGVGESPDDEYVLYYNPESYKMEWLGYTVTYFSKEKSKDFHFIKYSNWQNIEGLVLPKTLSWYKYENNMPTEKRNDLEFTNIKLSKEKLDAAIFKAPKEAIVVE